jgi:hypothetical protein
VIVQKLGFGDIAPFDLVLSGTGQLFHEPRFGEEWPRCKRYSCKRGWG